MKPKTNIKLDLSDAERQALRRNKIRKADVHLLTIAELATTIAVSTERAKELRALAEFQSVPSVGIEFARDLVSMGYHSINELKRKNGAKLVEEFERQKGYWIDPCLEDQFRLIVHYANTNDNTKTWWDFTEERKAYRQKHGYPRDRPTKAWFELLGYKKG